MRINNDTINTGKKPHDFVTKHCHNIYLYIPYDMIFYKEKPLCDFR